MSTTRAIRAVIYGVGEMGAIVTRLAVERGVQIVGAIGRSPAKVGRDLGDVVGLGKPLGVVVEDDANAVLARGADIALVCVGSYLDTMHEHFETCLTHGVNVLTIEEETVYPWTTAPRLSQHLDALARQKGVTLAASGAQDVFWVNLVAVLTGASHRIDRVAGHCRWNVDDYGPEVAHHLKIGTHKDDFDRFVSSEGWPEFVARQTLEAIVARLGMSVKTIASDVTAVTHDRALRSTALSIDVAPGHVIGTVDRTQITTVEGSVFEFSMEGRLYEEGDTDSNDWQVEGEPNLHLSNTQVPYRFTTCSTLVNRIPDVIAAAPGLVSLDQLGAPRCHPNMLHHEC
mgnify:CR=1 FL=1